MWSLYNVKGKSDEMWLPKFDHESVDILEDLSHKEVDKIDVKTQTQVGKMWLELKEVDTYKEPFDSDFLSFGFCLEPILR